jgi:hypothetical protein
MRDSTSDDCCSSFNSCGWRKASLNSHTLLGEVLGWILLINDRMIEDQHGVLWLCRHFLLFSHDLIIRLYLLLKSVR